MFRKLIIWLFRKPSQINGSGHVRHADGSVTWFTLRGNASPSLLRKAHERVFGRMASLYPRQMGAITHSTAIRNSIADLVVDALDGGTGAGYLEFQASGGTEVATCPFSATAFGAASSGTATANTITSDTNATGGTIAQFDANDGDDVTIFAGSVGTGGEDINMPSVVIAATETVAVDSLTYTAPD